MPTIYFDITTSASWGGPPVGITRTEREIAKRAAEYCRWPVAYCFFHMATGRYYELDAEFAARVLEGECWIQREAMQAMPVDVGASSHIAAISDSLPAPRIIAQLRRELEGSPLSRVLQQRATTAFVTVNTANGSRLRSVSRVVRRPVPLRHHTWIINGGLDWEHKNLRHLRKIKTRKNFNYVAIIYDVIPLLYPQYVVPFYVDLLKRYFGELFWTADYAMCISATTQRDVQNHLEASRLPALAMENWPLGCDIETNKGSPGRLPSALTGKRYLLYVSTIEPRKSHRTIIDAFEHGLRNGQIADDAMCVFVGRVGWNVENLVEEIRTNPLLMDRVLLLSGVSDNDLLELYRQSRFVVFPSRYEGYGLALVEAMALGKACIAGDAGSLKEVGGDAPLYIDPIELPRWAQAIAAAFADDQMIADLERKSKSEYVPITWDESARRFYGALNAWMEAAA